MAASVCVVINPGAGGGGAGEGDVIERLEPLLAGWEVRTTERAGHARDLAEAAAREGFETVIAAGGDGTVNEVVNGLAAAAGGLAAAAGGLVDGAWDGFETRLGVLPLGTGNDLARLLGMPADPERSVEALRRGVHRRVDLVAMENGGETRHFLNVAAGGFTGSVDGALTPEIKRAWGPLSYLRAATSALADLATYRLVARFDGDEEVEIEALNAVAANGRFAGAGIPIAPLAHPADGRLDVVLVPAMSMGRLAAVAASILAGEHLGLFADGDGDGERVEATPAVEDDEPPPELIYRRCRRLEIDSDPPMPWNADGELLGERTPSFTVLPGALEVLVGETPGWDEEEGREENEAERAPAAGSQR